MTLLEHEAKQNPSPVTNMERYGFIRGARSILTMDGLKGDELLSWKPMVLNALLSAGIREIPIDFGISGLSAFPALRELLNGKISG